MTPEDKELCEQARQWVNAFKHAGKLPSGTIEDVLLCAAARIESLSTSRRERDNEVREAAAAQCDARRDVALNTDLQTEPLLWLDGYEHGCADSATAIRKLKETD